MKRQFVRCSSISANQAKPAWRSCYYSYVTKHHHRYYQIPAPALMLYKQCYVCSLRTIHIHTHEAPHHHTHTHTYSLTHSQALVPAGISPCCHLYLLTSFRWETSIIAAHVYTHPFTHGHAYAQQQVALSNPSASALRPTTRKNTHVPKLQ